jgi:hypothetical protein
LTTARLLWCRAIKTGQSRQGCKSCDKHDILIL